jgi:hypothetical protein
MKNMKNKTIVTAAFCKECNVWIYSRSRHDQQYCPKTCIAIDGGRSYIKLCFSCNAPKTKKFTINATEQELYDDWNTRGHKYGTIKIKKNVKIQK